MATYAVGDVQGCYDSLRRLLDSAAFDPAQDHLWLAGDLVNRGPHSLATLRFVKSLGSSAVAVLGNHDLHLLASAQGLRPASKKDTFSEVLEAPDARELLNWVRHWPLLHCALGYSLCHAGIPPIWTLQQAQQLAQEVEAQLRSDAYGAFLQEMYGNQPDTWSDDLTGTARWRLITNYFTRMRFCSAQGQLNLTDKESAEQSPAGFAPWFSLPHAALDAPILFGHWAALEGRSTHPNAIALDTGCVWGKQLSMLRLEDRVWFRVASELAPKGA